MHWHQLRSQISQVFQVTSHVVLIFALHFVSPIQLLSLRQFIQFLTCTRIPCRDSHYENGLVRFCLYSFFLMLITVWWSSHLLPVHFGHQSFDLLLFDPRTFRPHPSNVHTLEVVSLVQNLELFKVIVAFNCSQSLSCMRSLRSAVSSMGVLSCSEEFRPSSYRSPGCRLLED